MIGKAGAGGDGKVVEHEERGKIAEFGCADAAADAGAGAFGLLDCKEGLADGAGDGHVGGFGGREEGMWNQGEAEEVRAGRVVGACG